MREGQRTHLGQAAASYSIAIIGPRSFTPRKQACFVAQGGKTWAFFLSLGFLDSWTHRFLGLIAVSRQRVQSISSYVVDRFPPASL
ncbi:hypothetical protein Pla52o_57830 [Novipirellula galeiformis]|uniref:Uncharacterized protein n=1 Tax=Novipirellula galeiformis TaxID=2528004 RepID=A0A5C6BFL3_9BACT|nr:hypothetical protein Pla52o_57830 [Novipirellula galeiformis]